jgi:hypothetical protein
MRTFLENGVNAVPIKLYIRNERFQEVTVCDVAINICD